MYFGSVRFFKHLILVIVLAVIIVLTVSTFVLGSRMDELKTELEQLSTNTSPLNQLNPVDIEEKTEYPELDPNNPTDGTGDNATTSAAEGDANANGGTVAASSGGQASKATSKYSKIHPEMSLQPVSMVSVTEKTVYLTFDDGPGKYTDDILQVLGDNNIKATFFLIANENTDPADIKKIYDAGHSIGVHSASHNYNKIYDSVEKYLDDMYICFNAIEQATGEKPKIVRLPGGSNNPYNKFSKEIKAELARRGFTYFDWNISAEDVTGQTSPEDIVKYATILPPKFNKYIALMHDGAQAENTVKALPEIIEFYKSAGIKFDKLTQETYPIIFE